jgi:hypothetical protein
VKDGGGLYDFAAKENIKGNEQPDPQRRGGTTNKRKDT